MKGLILTIAMTVVSMVSYSQIDESKAIDIHRITEPPVNQWYSYGDGVRLCFEGSDANKAFDHLMKTRASDEPTEFVKYLDPYTGEFFEVEIHRTNDDLVVFFQIGYRVIITLNQW